MSSISEKSKHLLWGKSAGRCQYEGCNRPLWIDPLTQVEFNAAYVAHIVADSPDGPRGDLVLSEKLKDDISNLMLMCDEHHRLIDRIDIKGHPVEKLKEMKRKHEERIQLLASLTVNKQSHVILYGANIGHHRVSVNWDDAVQAMLPLWYPAEKPSIELSLGNSSFEDNESSYWQIERENLERQFVQKIKPILAGGNTVHLSVFAMAPQPLLIAFGRLLSDIVAAEVYQLHREPPNWIWQEHPHGFDYVVREPDAFHKVVALNLSLSATIDNSRIRTVLGKDTSIWSLTIDAPHNDFLKSRDQLSLFRYKLRRVLDRIKSVCGDVRMLHLFPAVPVSVAIDIGRVWMPKADLPLRVYDQNRENGGFVIALDITT
jgi:hypothetical protein